MANEWKPVKHETDEKKQEISQANEDEAKLEKTQYMNELPGSNLDKTSKSQQREKQSGKAQENRLAWATKYYSKKQSVKLVCKEFVSFKAFQHKFTTQAQGKNYDKCRYADISCIDSTRVILKERTAKDDFIHANWMKMPDGFRYISTQGPLDNTMEDFWHMVFTEKVTSIAMFCDFCENGMNKCAQYIPDKGDTKKCGRYTVKRIGKVMTPFDDVRQQQLEVTSSKADGKVSLFHFQYLQWPDHIAPRSSSSILKLHKHFRQAGSPAIVHCSAGIGRTATFVGIDYSYQRLAQNPDMTMLEIIREMRSMRDKAVQTYFQYVFMIICVTDLFIADGVPKNDNMTTFNNEYAERLEKNIKKKAAAVKSQDK